MQKKYCHGPHDDIGASLSSILIYSELAQKTILSKPTATQNILNNISVLSRKSVINCRILSGV
ncbi:MAG: histidine kinase dimerization/phosphoacceptor domain-containing protein [Saprospiraceae bacterium]|nr:histidine kinase dimerization/phosphoacceptor domain-containing protein [Saprospiraceae bacterium]